MKANFFSIFFLIVVSCQKEGILTQQREITSLSPYAQLKYTGLFEPTSGITVSGSAKIYWDQNRHTVSLEGFSISDGPDLKVYLSKSDAPTQFVNLGNLTHQTVYPIPVGVQIEEYSHVLIHCQQYNHLFAIAELQQN